jgi:hypothetical protein
MTQANEVEPKVPSRAEHKRFIKRVWIICNCIAFMVFFVTGGTLCVLFLKGYDSKDIVNTSTAVFQVMMVSYGMGFFVPAFLTSLIKMSLGVEMSRRGIEIGVKTAQNLDEMRQEIKPLVEKGDRVLTKLEPMVQKADQMLDEFKKQDLSKLHKVLERFETEMNGGGKLDRLINALERIAKKADIKADDALGDLLEEAWKPPEDGSPKEDE